MGKLSCITQYSVCIPHFQKQLLVSKLSIIMMIILIVNGICVIFIIIHKDLFLITFHPNFINSMFNFIYRLTLHIHKILSIINICPDIAEWVFKKIISHHNKYLLNLGHSRITLQIHKWVLHKKTIKATPFPFDRLLND